MESQEFQLSEDTRCLYVVSDIHAFAAPLVALEPWLAKEGPGLSVAYCGDVCEGGMDPAEAAAWVIRHSDGRAVLGNHDEIMLRGGSSESAPNTEAGAYQRLDETARAFWHSRPMRAVLHWRGQRIVLMHGHRTLDKQPGSWRSSPAEQAAQFFDPQANLVVLGHTHFPYVRRMGPVLMANPGSVSLPILAVADKDGLHQQGGGGSDHSSADLRGSFLRVTHSGKGLEAELIHFEYDRARELRRLEASGHPKLEYLRCWMTEGLVDFNLRNV